MGTEHVINRIKDDILAASASVEGEKNDMYEAGLSKSLLRHPLRE